ncbi:MAG: hypothetical protein ACLQJ7_05790 [Syntrophobacteraceae bacterium]
MRIRTLVVMVTILATAGCASMMPPQKIPMDRVNYLDAVSTSWKEQLLTNLVKLRYGDTLTNLEIASVTTAYELDVGLSAGNTINWSPLRNTTGFHDTTALGASAAYSDKPTITYVPMMGESLQKTMIEPLSPLNILKNLQTATLETASLLPLCVKSINGWRSLDDTEFCCLARVFMHLSENGVIRITVKEPAEQKVTKVPTDYTVTMKSDSNAKQGKNREAQQGKKCNEVTAKKKDEGAIAFLVVDNARAKHVGLESEVRCLKCLLGFHSKPLGKGCPDSQGGYNTYEIINGNEEPPSDPCCEKVIIRTRSIMQTLVLMSELIDVPKDENNTPRKGLKNPSNASNASNASNDCNDCSASNASYPFDPSDPSCGLFKTFHICCQDVCPQNTFVSIKYCGHWFYIDNRDILSKITFSSILGVLSMAETGTTTGVPILTLPVQ